MAELLRFQRKARRAGGTLAVTIPPEIQKAVGLREGQDVEIYMTTDKKIVIEPKRKA